MFRRLSRVVVFFAAVQILGGHWLALQTVAWMGMLASYTRGETLAVALEKTFDGEHPCDLCKVVKSGRENEQKQAAVKVIVKLDAVLAGTVEVAAPAAVEWNFFVMVPWATARTAAPPTPPPQVA